MTEEERAKAGDEEKISLRLDLNFFFFFTIRKYDSFDLVVRNLSNRILKFCNEINFIRNVSQFSNDLNKKFKNIFTRDCNILCQNFHRRNIFNNALVISKNRQIQLLSPIARFLRFFTLRVPRSSPISCDLRSLERLMVDPRFMVPRIVEIDTVVLHLSTEEKRSSREFTTGR